MSKTKFTLCLLMFSVVTPSAWGFYWVESFSSSPQGYQIIRASETIPVRPLMRLKPGDQISVLNKDGSLTLVPDNKKRVALKYSGRPFQIPAEAKAPEVSDNLFAWAKDWWEGPKLKTLENVLAASRGTPPIVSLATTYDANLLFAVKDKLIVRWVGGEAPYRVILSDANGKQIALQEQISEKTVRFDGLDKDVRMMTAFMAGLDLPSGNYILKIHDYGSEFMIDLTHAGDNEKPAYVDELLAMSAPESIRWGYVAMRLAEQPQWRFQALQIAETWKLEAVAQAILTRD